jgi:hypothetical protein
MSKFYLLPVVAFAAVAVGVVGNAVAWESTHDEVTATVESKDRTTNKDGGSDTRIYTDAGVFTVSDDFFQGQWNSADTYGSIEEGETYTFDTVGWRNGFFSVFPNIISVEKEN